MSRSFRVGTDRLALKRLTVIGAKIPSSYLLESEKEGGKPLDTAQKKVSLYASVQVVPGASAWTDPVGRDCWTRT